MKNYFAEITARQIKAPCIQIPCGNVGTDRISFSFSDEWNKLIRYAVFFRGDEVVRCLLDKDNRCIIPHEITETVGAFEFGVSGFETVDGVLIERICSYRASGHIVPGAFSENMKDGDPAEDSEYEALITELRAHEDNKENPHRVTAGQVGAYNKAESDKLLSEKAEKEHTHLYAGAVTPGGAALEAVHAESADRAGTASSAVSAVYADRAGSAGTADTAEEANHAATSDSATNAAEAAHALAADNATNAASANTATEAEHAAEADQADYATRCGTASRATQLDSVRKINGVSFNGTKDITVYDPHVMPTVTKRLEAEGWYRIASKTVTGTNDGGLLLLTRSYNTSNAENYVLAFTQGYKRFTLNPISCDVGNQHFTKLRYIYNDDKTPCYIEVYYAFDKANMGAVSVISNTGTYTSEAFTAGGIPDGYSVKEFELPTAVEAFTAGDKAALDGKADAADVFDDGAFAWTDFTYSASESAGATVGADTISAASSSPITIHCAGETLGFTVTASGGSWCDLKINGLVVMHSNGDQSGTTLSYTLPLTRMTEDIVIELSASAMNFTGMVRRVGKWETELGNVDEALDAILAIQDAVIGGETA